MYRYNTHTHRRRSSGFTIIELMLAMTFLSMLLLAIALTTIQLSHIYTKGTTMREVNQAGRVVIDDLRRTIEASTPGDGALDDSQLRRQANGSGQLCLGTYSYVWNSPQSLATSANTLKYTDGGAIRFARVADKARTYCKPSSPVPTLDRKVSTELLVTGDHALTMRQFDIKTGKGDLTSGGGQQLYVLSFEIGTNTGDESAIGSLSSCKAPGSVGDGGMQDYCSVNKFEIIVRAGGDSIED